MSQGGDPAGDSEQTDDLSAAAQRFINAGLNAIDKALSGNSQEFLNASRQQGGE
jgi:hypothetical protein